MLLIGIRYCGGCNPEIDRPGLVENLKEGLEKSGIEVEFITDREAKIDLLLLVNGCKHACLEEEHLASTEDLPVLSVRGEMVGSRYIREKDVPEFLIGKIREIQCR